MFQVSENQKEQELLKLLANIEKCRASGQDKKAEKLLRTYQNMQGLKPGGSLPIREAVEVKKIYNGIRPSKKKQSRRWR